MPENRVTWYAWRARHPKLAEDPQCAWLAGKDIGIDEGAFAAADFAALLQLFVAVLDRLDALETDVELTDEAQRGYRKAVHDMAELSGVVANLQRLVDLLEARDIEAAA
jgi:hypothetical protein